MIKQIFYVLLIGLALLGNTQKLMAQQAKSTTAPLYTVWADAEADLKKTKKNALKSHKNILIFVGGNWCVWCRRLDAYLKSNDSLVALMKDYEVLHINYSKENKNEKVLATLNNPQTQGFPVIVVLDSKGNYRLTQGTGILESGTSYDFEKVVAFLKQWHYKNNNK